MARSSEGGRADPTRQIDAADKKDKRRIR
uniref:Uncharacterized protein n=1 Tax=Arundo donax TaxID=35708 RepID=A0A0A9CCH8_ARUDO